MDWSNITHIFQIPLEWFREISRRANIIGDGQYIQVERNNPDGTVLRFDPSSLPTGGAEGDYVTVDGAQTVTGAKTFTEPVRVETDEATTNVGHDGVTIWGGATYAAAVKFLSPGANSTSAWIMLLPQNVLDIRAVQSDVSVRLTAAANMVTLNAAPTIGQNNKTSKSVATCGWCNTQLAQVDHTHDDAYAAKTHAHGNITKDGQIPESPRRFVVTDAANNIVASTAALTPAEIAAFQALGEFSTDSNAPYGRVVNALHITNNYANRGTSGVLIYGNNSAGIELYTSAANDHGGYLDFHYRGSTANYTSRIIESAVGSAIYLRVVSTTGVMLDAPANQAVLNNPPTVKYSDTTNPKAIATVGWVRENCNGKPENVVESASKKVVTGVTWNGTQIVIASETWKITNGMIESITANANDTINTVTYNPS